MLSYHYYILIFNYDLVYFLYVNLNNGYGAYYSRRSTKKIDEALELVEIGAWYVHFKDSEKKYVVEFVGLLENSEEVCVGYRALYGKGLLWVRTFDDFFAEKEVEGKWVERFKKLAF